MLGWLERNQKQAPTARGRVTESKAVVGKATFNSSQSCVINGSVSAHDSGHRATVSTGVLVKSAMSKSCLNQACNVTHITEKEKLHTQTSDCISANSVIEDGDSEPRTGISDQNSSCKIVSLQNGCSKVDVRQIRETIKRKRWDRVAKEKFSNAMVEETDNETWIESWKVK